MLRLAVLLVAIATSAAGFHGLTQEECVLVGKIIAKQKTHILASLAVTSSSAGDVAEVVKYVQNIVDMLNGRAICEKALPCKDISCLTGITFEELYVVFKAALGDGTATSGCNACAVGRLFGEFMESLMDDAVMVVISGIARASGLTVQYIRPPCSPGTEPCRTRWSSILLNPK